MGDAFITLEIGCNHQGNLDMAFEMIKQAKTSGANAVKFQKRNSKELLTELQYNSPHPVPENSFGKTYGEHREYLEFSIDEHFKLSHYCRSEGIEYSCSVWDMTSAREIVSLNPKFIKVPSPVNNNIHLLRYLAESYSGDVHISLGMTTREEYRLIQDYIREFKMENRAVIYHCVSSYPTKLEDICVGEISNILKDFPNIRGVGLSGHHLELWPDTMAYALGARYFERHFTLNKENKGTDNQFSLTPTEVDVFGKYLKSASKALGLKTSKITVKEDIYRKKLKYSEK